MLTVGFMLTGGESFALLFLAKFLFRSCPEFGRKFLVLLHPWTTSEADSDLDPESDPFQVRCNSCCHFISFIPRPHFLIILLSCVIII